MYLFPIVFAAREIERTLQGSEHCTDVCVHTMHRCNCYVAHALDVVAFTRRVLCASVNKLSSVIVCYSSVNKLSSVYNDSSVIYVCARC